MTFSRDTMAPLLQSSYKVTMEDYDKHGCLHEMFVKQAKATPNNIAIVTNDGQNVSVGDLKSVTIVSYNFVKNMWHIGETHITLFL